jgi:hypothetical protein
MSVPLKVQGVVHTIARFEYIFSPEGFEVMTIF